MNNALKIALVSPYDYAYPGGVKSHIHELASQLTKWGHTVRIIGPCSDLQKVTDDKFIPMGRPISIPGGGSIARVSLSIWLRPRIRKLVEDESFDIIHVHNPFSSLVTMNILAASKATNIATFHAFGSPRLYRLGGTKIAKPYFSMLHGLIAVSNPARDFINKYFPGNYEIIPNGIHFDRYSNGITPYPNLKDGMTNLLFLGRLEKRKGLKYLVDAYSRLKWDWPNLRLLVVGPGNPDEDSLRMISERNLQDIVFVGGVPDEEKARYYQSSDIYCSPATGKESFGIVLLEAMASGKPIVATSIEGYSSVITNHKEGLLVPPNSGESLANAISTLLKNPVLSSKLAANGRKKAENFRWEKIASQVVDHYRLHLDKQNLQSKWISDE